MDGWHLGRFVYRAFKALREEGPAVNRSEEPKASEEDLVAR
jgi:hypothetical protein